MSNQENPLGVGLLAGLGLCLGLAGQARAGSYAHAEITLGFPHGAITVGNTWESEPREVVVERVTHKYPEPDYDDEDQVVVEDRDYADDEQVVVEQSEPEYCPPQRVVIVRQQPRYERVRVVRRVYVDPRPRREVIVYGGPRRVVYGPSCSRVVVAPRHDRGGYRGEVHVRGGGHVNYGGHGDHGGGYRSGGSDRGPKNLFPENGSGRPGRPGGLRPARGVQQVAVGGHSH